MVPIWMLIVGIIVALLVGVLIGFALGVKWRKQVAEKEISSAEEEAKEEILKARKIGRAHV